MTPLRILQRVEEVLLAGGILAIAGLTILNVIARAAFGASLASAEELPFRVEVREPA